MHVSFRLFHMHIDIGVGVRSSSWASVPSQFGLSLASPVHWSLLPALASNYAGNPHPQLSGETLRWPKRGWRCHSAVAMPSTRLHHQPALYWLATATSAAPERRCAREKHPVLTSCAVPVSRLLGLHRGMLCSRRDGTGLNPIEQTRLHQTDHAQEYRHTHTHSRPLQADPTLTQPCVCVGDLVAPTSLHRLKTRCLELCCAVPCHRIDLHRIELLLLAINCH